MVRCISMQFRRNRQILRGGLNSVDHALHTRHKVDLRDRHSRA